MGCGGGKVCDESSFTTYLSSITEEQKKIYNSFQNPILIVKDGFIIFTNSNCLEKFGYTIKDIVGKKYDDYIIDDLYFNSTEGKISISINKSWIENNYQIIYIQIRNDIEKHLLSNPHLMYFCCNEKYQFTKYSKSVENTLGYNETDLIGKNGFDYLHPDDIKPLFDNATKKMGSWCPGHP